MLNVAIVGYGYWGPNLARNFSESEGSTLRAICDQDVERLERARNRFPSAKCVTDIDDLLNDPRLDAVAIATPVHTHYELARRALEAGKHVLVEKPLTMRTDHAEMLVALADRKKLVLMVDHVFLFSPAVSKIKELVDSGQLGELFFIDSVRINLGLFQHDVNVIWDLAPHDLSIVDFMLGKLPVSLSAIGSAHAGNGIEDVGYLNLDYGNATIANFHVNWLSPVKVRQMIIGGSERSLIYNDMDASEKIKIYNRGIDIGEDKNKREQLMISYRSGEVWSPNISSAEPLSLLTRHFADCIADGKEPISGGESALRVVKILDGAQRSIEQQGARIAL